MRPDRPRNLSVFPLRGTIALLTVVAVTLLVLVLPLPGALSLEGRRALCGLVLAAGLFVVQPVSLPLTSLLVIVSLVFLGAANVSEAFEPLSRPTIMLVMGTLFLAEALRKHGISRRLALTSIVVSNGDPKRILLGLMLVASFLSMWMENTATAAVLIPVALTVTSQVTNKQKADRFNALFVLGIAYAASLGGMVTIMGSASNIIASGFLIELREWGFLDWFSLGFPSFILVFPFTWLLLMKLIPVGLDAIDISTAREQLSKLGGVSTSEWAVLCVFSSAIVLWILGPSLEAALASSRGVFSPAVVAIIAVTVLALTRLLGWDDLKEISWGTLFTIAAGLSLGDAVTRTDAPGWLASLLSPFLSGYPMIFSVALFSFASILLTNVMSNAAVVAIFAPIIIFMSYTGNGFNPVQLLMPLALSTTFGYSLPSASGRMALISAMGLVRSEEVLKIGVIVSLVSGGLLVLLFSILLTSGFI